jgi:DNA polymerase IV
VLTARSVSFHPARPSAGAVVRGTYPSRGVPRTIAHLDLDAFYATVELHRRPELKGLPVIVAGSGPRAVVTTASYEARRFGVGSAMPAARARRLCPAAVVIPPDFAAYREVSREVMDLVTATVDVVEVVGLDEAYLDLSDLHSPRAAMRRLVQQIREGTGMSASVGIGPNRLVAKVASDAEKPGGFVVLTREQACERFADAPPGLVPGIGPKTAARLEALGIGTLRALAHADEAVLREHFGANQGPWLRARGRFQGSAVVDPVREAVSESRETTFDEDIADPHRLEAILLRLAAELSTGLRRHDRAGRTIAIKVRLDDWTTVTRARTIEAPTNDPGRIGVVALQLLREYAPARPVRLLGVRVAAFGGAAEREDPGQLALEL